MGADVARCFGKRARAHEIVIHAGSINRDHVHMLLSIPPSLSDEVWAEYIKNQTPPEPDDDFKVT